MTDGIGSKIAITINRFEHDALTELGAAFEGGIDELMALHIVRQIDRERQLRKAHHQLLAGNDVWFEVDRPDEPSFTDHKGSGRSPGSVLVPWSEVEKVRRVEPATELPDDNVRLTIDLSPIIQEELTRFGADGLAYSTLIKRAVESALLPPDIEE